MVKIRLSRGGPKKRLLIIYGGGLGKQEIQDISKGWFFNPIAAVVKKGYESTLNVLSIGVLRCAA